MGKVTREAVFNAAIEIAAKGERPSQSKIRQHLGGGSFSDIGPILRDWQQGQKVGTQVTSHGTRSCIWS